MNNELECPYCFVKLEIGQAIDPKYSIFCKYRVSPLPLTQDTLELISCYKCPKCGYSDDTPNPMRL